MTRTATDSADGDPLGQLREIRQARQELDRRQDVAVRRARNAGYSWAEIALLLGVSRQAAHKRYGKRT